MKNSIKGMLLSGLIFPGAGQIALRCYGRGAALIVIILAAFAAMVVKGTQIALTILGKIEAEGQIIDMQTISEAANRAVTASDSLIIQGCLLLIILCWIFAIVDAFLIGRKMDRQTSNGGL